MEVEVKEKIYLIKSKTLIFKSSYSVVGIGVSYHKTYDVICVIDFAAEYVDHLEQHQKTKFFQKQKSSGNYEDFQPQHEITKTFSPQKIIPGDFNTLYRESPTKSMPQMHNSSAQMKASPMEFYQSKPQQPARFMNGQTNFMSNFQTTKEKQSNYVDFDLDDDCEWPEGAVKCKEKKHSKIVGNMKITKVVKLFLMKDGKTEIIENTLKELI